MKKNSLLAVKPKFNNSILSKINQRQAQILLHSCIYYRFGTSIITDAQFDDWSKELVKLRKYYPLEASESHYNNRFINFDGTTGFNLYTDDFIKKAEWFIENER